MTPHDFAAQGRLLAAATPGPWWTDGFAMGLRHLRRKWEPPDGFDLPTERDAIWLTDLRNTIDDLRAVVVAAKRLAESCHANLLGGVDVNAMDHGNLVGFPCTNEGRQRAKAFCGVLNEVMAALARFSNVGEVRS